MVAEAESDLFLGPPGNFTRIPHESDVQASVYPRWSFLLENNDTEWGPKATLKLTITYNSPPDATPAKGNYDVKMIVINSISDESFFSI